MTNTTSFGFGLRLKGARKAAKLTGAELGAGAGEGGRDASKASVSDWEHERHYPKADQLRVICLKLNISADHLVFGDIKDELKLIQAETTIQMLSPEQRQMLLARMIGEPVAEQSHENTIPKDIERVNTGMGQTTQIDTFDNKDKYKTRTWPVRGKDQPSGNRSTDTPARPERKRAKNS